MNIILKNSTLKYFLLLVVFTGLLSNAWADNKTLLKLRTSIWNDEPSVVQKHINLAKEAKLSFGALQVHPQFAGRSILMEALYARKVDAFDLIFLEYLEESPRISGQVRGVDKNKRNLLHHAAATKDTRVIDLVLLLAENEEEREFLQKAEDREGNTPADLFPDSRQLRSKTTARKSSKCYPEKVSDPTKIYLAGFEGADTEVGDSARIPGQKGLFANENIDRDVLITWYQGSSHDPKEDMERESHADDDLSYCMNVKLPGSEEVRCIINAFNPIPSKMCKAAFINHSTHANVEFQTLYVDGNEDSFAVAVVANRNIKKGEELFAYYDPTYDNLLRKSGLLIDSKEPSFRVAKPSSSNSSSSTSEVLRTAGSVDIEMEVEEESHPKDSSNSSESSQESKCAGGNIAEVPGDRTSH